METNFIRDVKSIGDNSRLTFTSHEWFMIHLSSER